MSNSQEKYNHLLQLQRRIATLNSIESALEWDERTYIPKNAADFRSEQTTLCAGLRHEWNVSPEIGDLLATLESSDITKNPLSDTAVNLREWRRRYDRQVKLPQSLVEELTRAKGAAHTSWLQSRETKNYTIFQPALERVFDLTRQVAECIGYIEEPYDALIDEYEPGASTLAIAATLKDLKDRLVPLVDAVRGSSRHPDRSMLMRNFPAARQQEFLTKIATALGYDFNRGRLDATVHPFCTTLGPSDIRITTRYKDDYLSGALFGVIHEAGHALYEQNLPLANWGTPRGEAVSLGIHESQSRLWENFVGRSLAFWEYWYPQAQATFPTLADVKLKDFHFAINSVEPGFIRVEADELTYNLHIVLRFELERDIINRKLSLKDLPEAWNTKFKAYFGVKVPDDLLGCLQDIHWASGYIGYFPTYTLGNLNAAQLFRAARRELGDLDSMFHRGDFDSLRRWLTEKVHNHGMKYRPAELIKRATGETPGSDALIEYFTGKFGKLYGINL